MQCITKNAATNVVVSSNISKGRNERKTASSLDTLAQPATKSEKEELKLEFGLVDKSDIATFRKRARGKYIGHYLSLALVQASEYNEKGGLTKAYWNTFHCNSILTLSSEGKVTGSFCKNRFCQNCNRIRTAQLINRYQEELKSWEKYFVTFTLPNCEKEDLKAVVEWMQKTFIQIKRRFDKQVERGKREKFVGLRKLECTYNPRLDNYHPHYHCLIKGKKNAEDFLQAWQNEVFKVSILYLAFKKKIRTVSVGKDLISRAQDIRVANDKSTVEMFKYFTKLISGKQSNSDQDNSRMIYADALDVIFNAVKGKRVFQNFGFKGSSEEDSPAEKKTNGYAIREYKYSIERTDWVSRTKLEVDHETGLLSEIKSEEWLTNYRSNSDFKNLVENRIIVRKNFHTEKARSIIRAKNVVVDEKKFRKACDPANPPRKAQDEIRREIQSYLAEYGDKKVLAIDSKRHLLIAKAKNGSQFSLFEDTPPTDFSEIIAPKLLAFEKDYDHWHSLDTAVDFTELNQPTKRKFTQPKILSERADDSDFQAVVKAAKADLLIIKEVLSNRPIAS